MTVTIENSRAIITGGAQGIGLQICHDLLMHGAKVVVIIDIDELKGVNSMTELNRVFGQNRCLFFTADVAKADEFEVIFNKAVEKLGGLEILINNAGIFNDEQWSDMIDINIKGTIHGCLLGIDYMGKHNNGNGGTVINIASAAAFVRSQYMPIYSTTKSAVVALTQCLAANYKRTGVAMKSMCPGVTDTLLLENIETLNFVNKNKFRKMIKELPKQSTKDVAKEIIRLICDAPNGTIWTKSTDMPLSTVNIPKLSNMVVPI